MQLHKQRTTSDKQSKITTTTTSGLEPWTDKRSEDPVLIKMFPSFHEFKSEQQYDPYFPSHQAAASNTVTPITEATDYNTYQNGYSQYTQQSWSGSSNGSQPSPQPHNAYYGPGPGPVDGGGGQSGPGGQQDYCNNHPQQQSYSQQGANANYYQQPQFDQYNYGYDGGGQWQPQQPQHPPPGSSPPLYPQYGIKNEYDMKSHHPGAIPPPAYYGGQQSPSPHLMGLQPQPQQPMMQEWPPTKLVQL